MSLRFRVSLCVIAFVLAGAEVRAQPVSCTLTFALQDAVTVGALQFDVDYSATTGDVVGDGQTAQCNSFVSGLAAFNDVGAAHTLHWGVIALSGMTGPTNIGSCTFVADTAPTVADFAITVDDSAPTDVDGTLSNVCGAPATGASPPYARDALVILRNAVGLPVSCQIWECDVNGNGSITTSDSLLALRRAVELPGDLNCPACDEPCPPSSTPPSASVTVAVALECEVQQVCGDGNVTGTEQCDDGNLESGDCCSEGCAYEPAQSPCQDQNLCTTDVCDGAGSCSHEAVEAGTSCRDSTGVCDAAEICVGDVCPPDTFLPETTVCRAAAGICDPAEACTGDDAACPADDLADVDTVCRPAAGVCDVAETCTGLATGCPVNGFRVSGVACGSASETTCDGPDVCDGLGFCDTSLAIDGTSCDADTCTADQCLGGTCETVAIPNCPLVPEQPFAGDEFGAAVALTPEYLVVGAPSSKNAGSGRVYVFRATDDGYVEQSQTTPIPLPFQDPDQATGALDFGTAVDADQDTIVAGAPFDVVTVGDKQSAGSASVFFFNGTVWVQQAKLVDASGLCTQLGTDVALSGNTVVLGAPDGDCALVFERTGSQWTLAATLGATVSGSRFGRSVDISGDSILVGAPGASAQSGCSPDGSVYAFRRTGVQWNLEETIDEPAGSGGGACFGAAVAVDGAGGVVGAPFDDTATSNAGAAYIVERSGEQWSITEQLLAFPTASDDDGFGSSLDIRGDVLIVGAPAVAAYLFQSSAEAAEAATSPVPARAVEGKWTSERIYLPPENKPSVLSKFAFSVAVAPGSAVAGAPGEDPGGLEDAGAVYPSDSAPVPAVLCGDGNVTPDEDCDDGDTKWKAGQFCDAGCNALACGDPNDSGTITTADALFILRTAVKTATCDLLVCDVNKNGTITTSDALQVLKKSVGVGVTLKCS